MLKIYNTLTKKKENFKPLKNKKVGIYTCGPTVYNHAHIGNLRSYIFADILNRFLKFSGYKVKWVMNITDVDDKTIRNSKKAKKSLKKFTEYYKKIFFEDIKKLNINKADFFSVAKATEHIPEMQELIKVLLRKELAYVQDSSIYFSIKKYIEAGHKYGQLVNIDLTNLKISQRIEADEYEKNNPQDFALWKKKKNDEPSWDFDIEGKNYHGRPGWHIECSAMSRKYLGNPFDIHTGGIDLAFPHHEDEIAQTEGAYNLKIANYFMHNEHLLVDNKKMAKSLGNFLILDDIRSYTVPLAFRMLMLQAHYQDKLNFTKISLLQAQGALEHLYEFIRKLLWIKKEGEENRVDSLIEKTENGFNEAMEDNLSTPKALTFIWDLKGSVNKLIDAGELNAKEAKLVYNALLKFDQVLGLGMVTVEEPDIKPNLKEWIEEYKKATTSKDYQKKEEFRKKFEKAKYKIEDTRYGIPRITFKG